MNVTENWRQRSTRGRKERKGGRTERDGVGGKRKVMMMMMMINFYYLET